MSKSPWYLTIKRSTFVVPNDTGCIWIDIIIHPVYMWWIFIKEFVKLIWNKVKSK